MDRGKTIGCGALLTISFPVTFVMLGDLGTILAVLGIILVIIGFCMRSGDGRRAEYRPARRVPRHGPRR